MSSDFPFPGYISGIQNLKIAHGLAKTTKTTWLVPTCNKATVTESANSGKRWVTRGKNMSYRTVLELVNTSKTMDSGLTPDGRKSMSYRMGQ
jgi:hypothetical protein